jgi:hypothetical protein
MSSETNFGFLGTAPLMHALVLSSIFFKREDRDFVFQQPDAVELDAFLTKIPPTLLNEIQTDYFFRAVCI